MGLQFQCIHFKKLCVGLFLTRNFSRKMESVSKRRQLESFVAIFKLLFLLIFSSLLVKAIPIRKVILDLDETIIQRNQEYRLEEGILVPSLESFDIKALYPDGTIQERTYYLRPGARQFLTYLVGEVKNKSLDVSFLSKSHQARLNAVLEAIQIGAEPISHYAKLAFGSEIVNAYSTLKRPDRSKRLKDFDLIFHPKANKYYQHLKKDDRTFLAKLTVVTCVVPNDTLMIDDSPSVTSKEYHDHIVALRDVEKKDGYWEKYKKYLAEPETLETSFERQSFLADLEIEKHQFEVIQWLMEDAKKTELPNDYSPWGQMLDAPKILVTEKIHFRYLIADLLLDDNDNQDIVVVGRDMDLFNEVIDQPKEKMGIKSRIVYIPMSRIVATKPENILRVLKANGIDLDRIRNGTRKLKFVDGGYRGTVPGNVIQAVFENVPNWQDHVQNITAHLFTSESKGGLKDPRSFSSLKDYVDASGFVGISAHQNRFGSDNLREVILHWEHARPKKHSRPYRLGDDDRVALDLSHPTENRVARLFDFVIRKLFWEDSVIKQIKAFSEEEIFVLQNRTVAKPVQEIKVSALPKISRFEQARYYSIKGTVRFFKILGIDFSRFMPEKPVALLLVAKKSEDHPVPTVGKVSHRGDPRSRRLNPYDNELSPQWVALLEDKKNITRSEFSYAPSFVMTELKVANETIARETDLNLMATVRNDDPRLPAMGPIYQAGKRRNTDILLQILRQKPISTDTLDRLILTMAQSYHSEHGSVLQIFRSFDYQTSVFKNKAKDLPNDWHWFVHWLQLQLNRPYDPLVLAGQVHYLLTYQMVPFQLSFNEVVHDILDLVFVRAGYVPLAWDDQTKIGLNGEDAQALETHIQKIAELAKKPLPARARSTDVGYKMCRRFYGN